MHSLIPWRNTRFDLIKVMGKRVMGDSTVIPDRSAPVSRAPRFIDRLIAWLGIFGAAFTLFSRYRGAFEFTAPLATPVDGWLAAMTAFWRGALAFLPRVDQFDAILLSFCSFLVMNAVNASRDPHPALRFGAVLAAIPAVLFLFIFVLSLENTEPQTSVIIDALISPESFAKFDRTLEVMLPGLPATLVGLINLVLTLLVVFGPPALLAVVILKVLFRALGRSFNLAAFTVRLWKILLAFVLLVAANAALVWAGV